MKKYPLLLASSVGVLGVLVTANAFASQVSDHGGAATAIVSNHESQDASTGEQNDDNAVESEASNGDQSDDGVTAGQQQGDDDQAENSSDDGSDHHGGDHTGGDNGEGGGGA